MADPGFQLADAVYATDSEALTRARNAAPSGSTRGSAPPDMAATMSDERSADGSGVVPRRALGDLGASPVDLAADALAGESGVESLDLPGLSRAAAEQARDAQPTADQTVTPQADRLVGLAISGGGIRSATFALGVLQRLAMRNRMTEFDLLSTVSGGGYIGAFLSAWIKRAGAATVWDELAKCPESNHVEPAPVQWLRRYSNYLTPRVGALSLDALTVVATYIRNVILNMSVLVAFVAACAAATAFLLWGSVVAGQHRLGALAIAGVLVLVAVCSSFVQLSGKPRTQRPIVVYLSVVLPTFMSCLLASVSFKQFDGINFGDWTKACVGTIIAIVAVLTVMQALRGTLWTKAPGAAPPIGETLPAPAPQVAGEGRAPNVSQFRWRVYAPATAIATAVGFLIEYRLLSWLSPMLRQRPVLTLVLGGPILLAGMALGVTLWIGLMGRSYPEMYREWWSRVGGALTLVAAGWVLWCGLALGVPHHLPGWLHDIGVWGRSAVGAITFGGVVSAIGLIRSISGSATPAKTLVPKATLAAVLAVLVLLIFVAAIDWGVYALIDPDHSTALSAGAVLGSAAVTALLLGWRVDINRFSLHDMYKNRLIRCYLGASNTKRHPNPFTGFDPADDVALADLAPFKRANASEEGDALSPGADATKVPLTPTPQRPFHIFNAALNLVHGSELSWQERKSALFVFTPTYCGYNLAPARGDKPLMAAAAGASGASEQAFRPTALYADNAPRNVREHYTTVGEQLLPTSLSNGGHDGFTLGMAMATSGAAVSPNMGANTQPALAMLMTFLNIRLGRWCANPAGKDWRRASPRSNLAWLLAEAAGNTNERSAFVYLSDGGHFENTAVYELARRCCSHIVMVDAGADPQRSFEDLGNLIRKVRVDLGAEIQLRLSELYALKSGRSVAGFVDGSITYAKGSPRTTGKILLIKPTLARAQAEPADVYNYSRSQPAFPQQTTMDQWFDESQFEAYRCLGSFITQAALYDHPDFFD